MSKRLNNAALRRSIGTSTAFRNHVRNPLTEAYSGMQISSAFYEESAQISPKAWTTISNGSQRLKTMNSTRNTRLSSPKTGSQLKRDTGTKESLTSKSLAEQRAELRSLSAKYRERKLDTRSSTVQKPTKSLSTTGKLERYTPSITTNVPFTVSPHSPNTLLCSKCERSTYTLILENSGRKPSIVTRCTNCGNRGKIVLTASSTLYKITIG